MQQRKLTPLFCIHVYSQWKNNCRVSTSKKTWASKIWTNSISIFLLFHSPITYILCKCNCPNGFLSFPFFSLYAQTVIKYVHIIKYISLSCQYLSIFSAYFCGRISCRAVMLLVVTWMVVYPLITGLILLLDPVVSSWALPLRTLLLSSIMVPLMVFWAMPLGTGLFHRFLKPAETLSSR